MEGMRALAIVLLLASGCASTGPAMPLGSVWAASSGSVPAKPSGVDPAASSGSVPSLPAGAGGAGLEKPGRSLPFYKSDDLRYPAHIVPRFFSSIVGTTVNMLYWDGRDWAYAGLTAAGTLAFMAPTDPSPDARLQFWIQERRTDFLDAVFPRLTSERFSAFGFALIGAGALAGLALDEQDLIEWSSLMLETLGVTQFLHVGQKLLVGREGPEQGDGRGIVYGPTAGPGFFPAGTPSGHTASVFALSVLTMGYFDEPWLDCLGYATWAYISVSVLYNNQHFISDVVWGAPLGYFIGKWMLEHRSSRYRYRDGVPWRARPEEPASFVGILPWGSPSDGVVGLSGLWIL